MTELGLRSLPRGQVSELARDLTELFASALDESLERLGRGFLGTMPMTLSRRHLMGVERDDYVILEKSDGKRYLLFVNKTGDAFLVDRRMEFYFLEPQPELCVRPQREWEPMTETVLDGELTFNFVYECFEYLVYDTVCLNGDAGIGKANYRTRVEAADAWVGRSRTIQPNVSGRLRIRVKDIHEKWSIGSLFKRITKNKEDKYIYTNHDRIDGTICNENDGLIFAPVGIRPYPIRACPYLLKWKPPHLNSVDFQLLLEKTTDPKHGPFTDVTLGYKGENKVVHMRKVRLPSATHIMFLEDFDYYNNSIAEFSYDIMYGDWKYLRQRDDKRDANYSTTVIDTLESIAENITREQLVDRLQPKAGAPPPPKRARRPSHYATMDGDLFNAAEDEGFRLTTPVSRILPPRRFK